MQERALSAALRDWIERFCAHLRLERRMSLHTAAAYRRDLESLARHLEQRGSRDWRNLDGASIRAFAAAEHASGLSPRSVQRRLSAIRSFYGYLRREAVVERNPAEGIRAPRGERRLPSTLDVDQMARLLSFQADDRLSARDKAIMELLYSSGLRLAELAGLNRGDIDLADATVRVLGKGAKTRIVPIGRAARTALAAWLGEHPGGTGRALFQSRDGRRLSPRAIQQRVALWARRQGIAVRVHPHLFRHSFATHLLESSADLRGVQELLGHANIGTTQIYTHLDFQHLASVYDASHPRARRRTRP